MDWTPIIIALLAALPGLLALRSNNRRTEADASERLAQTRVIEYDVTSKVLATANDELERHHKEIERLSEKIKELSTLVNDIENELEVERKERLLLVTELEIERKARLAAEQRVERYVIGIKKLIAQLVQNGHVPDWQPETGPLAPTKPTTP